MWGFLAVLTATYLPTYMKFHDAIPGVDVCSIRMSSCDFKTCKWCKLITYTGSVSRGLSLRPFLDTKLIIIYRMLCVFVVTINTFAIWSIYSVNHVITPMKHSLAHCKSYFHSRTLRTWLLSSV